MTALARTLTPSHRREGPGGAWWPDPRSELGEGPVWNPLDQTLTWVDAARKLLHRRTAGDETVETYTLPHYPGSYAYCADGTLLMAYRNGLARLDLGAGTSENLPCPGIDFMLERFNDGACDRAGRFWVGTMDPRMTDPVGALYRVDTDLTIRRIAGDVRVSNGLAFSPDDRLLYHTDSRSAVIWAWDFDLAAGEIENRRPFADFRNGDGGRPDGITTDTAGNVWMAMNGGGRVLCLTPDGGMLHDIALPTSRPTSLCFGGPGLDRLFVTSMQYALSEDERRAQPQAGCLFDLEPAASGLAEPFFAANWGTPP